MKKKAVAKALKIAGSKVRLAEKEITNTSNRIDPTQLWDESACGLNQQVFQYRHLLRIAITDHERPQENFDESVEDFNNRITSLVKQRDALIDRRERAPEIIIECRENITRLQEKIDIQWQVEKLQELMKKKAEIEALIAKNKS